MVSSKHRHSKDKLYLLPSELALTQAPVKSNRPAELVPLDSCFLTLLPFSNPFCTIDGHIFDHDKIKEFVISHGVNPVNGAKLALDDLFPIYFSKDQSGHFQCPLSLKRFTPSSHIVAVKPSGNVYSYNTLKEVAKKEQDGLMHDPITGVGFLKNDIITIQDPHNTALRTISTFKHINSYFKPKTTNSRDKINPPQSDLKHTNSDTNTETKSDTDTKSDPKPTLLEEHLKIFKPSKPSYRPKHELFTTGSQAASFTSTAVAPSYKVEFRDKTVFELRLPLYDYVKKMKRKGYVKLVTTDGDLNLLLHTDRVPLTCDNFLQHCEDKYYDGCEFFRCVQDFMIQTGDPTNTGLGGESSFYRRNKLNSPDNSQVIPKYLTDEFDNTLYHVGIGVVSMANKGKNTNGSQFFITFNTCEHLDNRHSVFGKVVGGLEILKKWNNLKVNDEERPLNPPKIVNTIVYSNPFEEAKIQLDKQKELEKLEEKKRVINSKSKWLLEPTDSVTNKKKNKVGYLINQ
ncbi:Cyclophilin type peptidyl-prolyl cis-trans isomerase/CLD family protein [Theileria parva strain Muguga]|uniref:Cyclophilin type peptidyl-prolyl cis-trans isomerase/CLD family protein n=1 Tax=Theileria parva strain Muguga TaxID=333668 RepID=UPI001C61A054|nr:Cyclophilin type peptidyl-prolyl cis-trans isomerase/CLD family protein [Theileria parva strain Muguga]EAN32863.2 Cyclophilin type peptidyl-prolyl cis-trans isomerase/CLD family protein [Theileria parva strain Muguga]